MNLCPNCGAAHDSPYCPACGQHRDAARLLSVRALASETARDVFSLDSRTVRTLRSVLLRPGVATLRYLAGERQAHVPPLRLYLVVSAMSIFLFALAGMLSLEFMLRGDRTDVSEMISALGADPRDPLFTRRFDAWLNTTYPLANVLSPIWIALGLKGLYPASYLHAHLVFALHVGSAIVIAGTPIFLLMPILGSAAPFLVLLVMAVYLFLAHRRVYDGTRIRLGLKYGALLVVAFVATELAATLAFVAAVLLARG